MKEKSKMYMIYELRDSLPVGIQKNQEVLDVENEFVDVLEKSGKKEKFQFMLNDWEENKAQLEKSIVSMKHRLEVAEKLVQMYEKQDETSKLIEEIVTYTFEILGIIKEEPEETEKA